jgi:cytochrome c biogenesis protein CcdA/thiol-disulfide isomerase/thioredoxin
MALLVLFALVAGAATALSPCVLPVLPVVLGAGVTGGRRRPLGVVTGLVASFTFATVALVYVIDAFDLPNGFLRTVAITTLLVFGVSLVIPGLGDRIEAIGSRIAPGPARVGGDGFASGVVLGASLGLVYTPCAGPILAAVITVSASQDFTAGKLAVALAYAIGSGSVLYLLMLGGRRIADRLRPWQAWVQGAAGAMMVAIAVAMVADLDLKFQNAIADDLPSVLVNPTERLESSEAVSGSIASLHGGGHAPRPVARTGTDLPDYGPAPDFVDTQQWFNTPNGKPLSIAALTKGQGRVVLIDFWTYTCINCIRTLPYVEAWDSKYRADGLTVIGVHSPEFAFEKDAGNVADAIASDGISYPVVQDNELGTWNAFANQYWPAKYLIDSDGDVRYAHFGEGDYAQTESAIRSLLAEAGAKRLGGDARPGSVETADPDLRTPETYLGLARAQGFVNGPQAGSRDYGVPDPGSLDLNEFAYGGAWKIGDQAATAGDGASVALSFQARRVFLVMGSPGRSRHVDVVLDGEPISDADAGADVSGRRATISAQRLYRLVDLPEAGRHTLELRFGPGIEAYAFTFG